MVAEYLGTVLDPKRFRLALRTAVRKLKPKTFEAIAVTGNSGAIFGGALAVALNKPLILVRKPGIDSHGSQLQGIGSPKSYIIVDDFISTGETVRRVCDIIEKHAPAGLDLVGGYFYKDGPVWHEAAYLKSL